MCYYSVLACPLLPFKNSMYDEKKTHIYVYHIKNFLGLFALSLSFSFEYRVVQIFFHTQKFDCQYAVWWQVFSVFVYEFVHVRVCICGRQQEYGEIFFAWFFHVVQKFIHNLKTIFGKRGKNAPGTNDNDNDDKLRTVYQNRHKMCVLYILCFTILFRSVSNLCRWLASARTHTNEIHRCHEIVCIYSFQ